MVHFTDSKTTKTNNVFNFTHGVATKKTSAVLQCALFYPPIVLCKNKVVIRGHEIETFYLYLPHLTISDIKTNISPSSEPRVE